MALKKLVRRMTAPVEVLDRERLRDFCARVHDVTPITELQPRDEATIVGEITSVRIVPQRDSAPWLEATVTDGTGLLVAMWMGRRRIPGIEPGRRLKITGRGSPTGPGRRLLFYNPLYELLA